jgi:hypothetical protein
MAGLYGPKGKGMKGGKGDKGFVATPASMTSKKIKGGSQVGR